MQDSPKPPPPSPAATLDAHAIDYQLLSLLCTHALITQIVYAMVRVTISYRTVELGLAPIWVGIITGASAVLPMLLAVSIGRYVDRGHDALTARFGSLVILGCCLGYRLSEAGLTELLFFTAFLGVGHTLLMVSQQMIVVRSARNDVSRETAFGHYMVATALGQGIGPLIVGWLGGSLQIPPTRYLFAVAVVLAAGGIAISFFLKGRSAGTAGRVAGAQPIPVRDLLAMRGVPTLMIASIITVTAQDLITIFLPLLGAQRGIDVANVGALLMVRSVTAVVSRVFYPSMMRAVGRVPLTVGTMAAASVGLVVLASPVPLPVLYVAVALAGFGLGIAATLSISNMVDIVPAGARGVALSLRITGNRVGQVSFPVAAGVIAAALGTGGIFAIMAMSLAVSAASVHVVRGKH
jgi:MFS family permease